MQDLITLLRYMQFYTHMAHNVLGGETFFQDHAFLGDLYPVYESDYDSLVERAIGSDIKINIILSNQKSASILEEPSKYKEAFENILECENDLCHACKIVSEKASIGLQNLLADISDRSEQRQYKIKQRIL